MFVMGIQLWTKILGGEGNKRGGKKARSLVALTIEIVWERSVIYVSQTVFHFFLNVDVFPHVQVISLPIKKKQNTKYKKTFQLKEHENLSKYIRRPLCLFYIFLYFYFYIIFIS